MGFAVFTANVSWLLLMQEQALQTQTSITEKSGISMDQKIENISLPWRKITLGIIILIAVVAFV